MILVRNTFQLKFGKAKDAKAVIKDGMSLLKMPGLKENRAYMDLSGPFYTLVLENVWDNLGAFEKGLSEMGKMPEWAAWYAKLVPLIESGHREIYSVIS
jgi:hypothetical protein